MVTTWSASASGLPRSSRGRSAPRARRNPAVVRPTARQCRATTHCGPRGPTPRTTRPPRLRSLLAAVVDASVGPVVVGAASLPRCARVCVPRGTDGRGAEGEHRRSRYTRPRSPSDPFEVADRDGLVRRGGGQRGSPSASITSATSRTTRLPVPIADEMDDGIDRPADLTADRGEGPARRRLHHERLDSTEPVDRRVSRDRWTASRRARCSALRPPPAPPGP